jgi:hypothetical protein
VHFQAPPGWPQPPDGWRPDAEWLPDADWPAPPTGWSFWGSDPSPAGSDTTEPRSVEQGRIATLAPPVGVPIAPAPARTYRSGGLWWAVLAALPILAGAILSGIPGALIFAGLSGLTTAVIALVRGHLAWALLHSRRAGGWAAAGATALLVGGGVLAIPSSTESTSATVLPAQKAAVTSGPTASASATPVPATRSDPVEAAVTSASPGLALSALAGLPVRPAATKIGYTRKAFGRAWADTDRNHCDNRSDVLRRDLSRVVIKPGTRGCTVSSGTVIDLYTGKKLAYRSGSATVSVDRVVSLADIWVSGARAWTSAKRLAFANDPLNLAVVATSVIKAKGDRNAVGWLPPRTAYRCRYVARQVAVKQKYGASVTPAERAAIGRLLIGCDGQKLPRTADVSVRAAAATSTTAGAKSPVATTTRATPSIRPAASAYYASCAAARAAGAAPLHTGRAGYRAGLDPNHDGLACE